MTAKEMTRPVKTQTTEQDAVSAPARRFDPFDFLHREIDRVFDSFHGWPAVFRDRTFTPSMQVTETEGAIEITTELPGMDEKDVEISVTEGLLTIRGEKKLERDEKKKNYRMIERSYGAFERNVSLPPGVDAASIKANMTKGVLTVDIPKPAAAKAQQVKISAV